MRFCAIPPEPAPSRFAPETGVVQDVSVLLLPGTAPKQDMKVLHYAQSMCKT
jgi:hypothetical protein